MGKLIEQVHFCDSDGMLCVLPFWRGDLNGWTQNCDLALSALEAAARWCEITDGLENQLDYFREMKERHLGKVPNGESAGTEKGESVSEMWPLIDPLEFAHMNGLGPIEGQMVALITKWGKTREKSDLERVEALVGMLKSIEYPETVTKEELAKVLDGIVRKYRKEVEA